MMEVDLHFASGGVAEVGEGGDQVAIVLFNGIKKVCLGGWPSALDNRPGTVCLPCFDFCTDYCESAPEALERFMRIGTVEEPATLDVASFLRNVPDTPDLVTQYCCLVENQVVFEQPASFFPETKYFC